MSVIPLSAPTKRLAVAITNSQTTFAVNNIKGWDGNNLSAANFGTVAYVVFRNSTNTVMEIMQIDPSTIANSVITVNLRGLDFNGGISEVSANKLAWPANDTLVDFGSDPAQLFTQGFMDLFNNQTVGGIKTFSVPPVSATNPTASTQVANKAYVDSVVAGSANYDQNLISGIAGETLTAGKLVYFKVSDGRWWKAQSTVAATADGVLLGFAEGSASAGVALNILIGGIDKNQSSLTAGALYYVSDTAGAISSSPGTVSVVIGQALTTTSIILSQRFTQVPTAVQAAALASTTTPGSGNKYLTQSDFQKGAELYAADAVGTDSYAITLSPAIAAYTTGQVFRFKALTVNTGPATLNVNGLGAKSILRPDGSALANGDIAANQIIVVGYDGTNLLMQSPLANSPKFAHGTTTIAGDAASATVNIAHGLGRAPRFVRISANKSFGTTSNEELAISEGQYDGSTTSCIYATQGNLVNASSGNSTTNIITISGDVSGASQVATCTVDATNIILVFTKTGSPNSANINILWRAEA